MRQFLGLTLNRRVTVLVLATARKRYIGSHSLSFSPHTCFQCLPLKPAGRDISFSSHHSSLLICYRHTGKKMKHSIMDRSITLSLRMSRGHEEDGLLYTGHPTSPPHRPPHRATTQTTTQGHPWRLACTGWPGGLALAGLHRLDCRVAWGSEAISVSA